MEHVCDTIGNLFRADPKCGNDQEFNKKIVVFDENMMSQIMNGFPNLTWYAGRSRLSTHVSTVAQDGVLHYIDVAEEFGLPSDVCPMPAVSAAAPLMTTIRW
ncbi:MAG: hypothetical protein ACLVJO_01965 [[Clostridium] scindens]